MQIGQLIEMEEGRVQAIHPDERPYQSAILEAEIGTSVNNVIRINETIGSREGRCILKNTVNVYEF